MSQPPPQSLHIPVLLDDVVKLLAPKKGESYLDLTAGYGGHARAVIDRTQAPNKATLVDRDPEAIAALQPFAERGANIIHAPFAEAAEKLAGERNAYDMILIDLGVSSPQFDRAERGFSLIPERSGALDMRMDQSQALSAATIVNRSSEPELIRIITEYGEERPARARAIARSITRARPLTTTGELAEVVLSSHRGGWQKVHPATRAFQAIRIAVNDELGQLSRTLPLLPSLLARGGRVAIISFHSLEDRMVKRSLNEAHRAGYEAELRLLRKKAVNGRTYDAHNPRARSAMLRAAVKT